MGNLYTVYRLLFNHIELRLHLEGCQLYDNQ